MDAEPFVYTLQEAERLAGLGRTKLYELISDDVLDARKAGSRTLITAASLRAYVDGLPRATIRMGTRAVCKAA